MGNVSLISVQPNLFLIKTKLIWGKNISEQLKDEHTKHHIGFDIITLMQRQGTNKIFNFSVHLFEKKQQYHLNLESSTCWIPTEQCKHDLSLYFHCRGRGYFKELVFVHCTTCHHVKMHSPQIFLFTSCHMEKPTSMLFRY